MAHWRTGIHYFHLMSLLYFLFGSALLGLSSPIKYWVRFHILLAAWLALWLLWRVKIRHERGNLSGAEVELRPPAGRPGQTITCSLHLLPKHQATLMRWSATLVGWREWVGEYDLEGDRTAEESSLEEVHCLLLPGRPLELNATLAIPADAVPSCKTEKEEVGWSVEVCVEFALSSAWQPDERFTLTVLPAA